MRIFLSYIQITTFYPLNSYLQLFTVNWDTLIPFFFFKPKIFYSVITIFLKSDEGFCFQPSPHVHVFIFKLEILI